MGRPGGGNESGAWIHAQLDIYPYTSPGVQILTVLGQLLLKKIRAARVWNATCIVARVVYGLIWIHIESMYVGSSRLKPCLTGTVMHE